MTGASRFRRASICAALLLALALSVLPGRAPRADDARIEEHLQIFLELTLINDPGIGRPPRAHPLGKRTEPIRVRTTGQSAGQLLDFLLPRLREIAAIAGLEVVALQSGADDENLLVEYREVGIADRGSCVTSADRNARQQWRSHIHVHPASLRRCITHELMHAVGFGHAHARDSIMSYVYSRGDLADLDILMLRVLYDSRLKTGMRWLPALIVAREILVEKLMPGATPEQAAAAGRNYLPKVLAMMKGYAENGDVELQGQLGFAYTFDEAPGVVEKDVTAGYRWFRRAADAGHVDGQANVGFSLMNGRGVVADPEEAVRWYRLAANRGHVVAQNNLGIAFRDGKGVARDPVEAYKWLSISAGRKYPLAERNLDRLLPNLTADQLDEGKRRAAAWTPASSP